MKRFLSGLLAILSVATAYSQPKHKQEGNRHPKADSLRMAIMANRFRPSNCSPRSEYQFQHNIVVTVKTSKPGKDSGSMKTRYLISDSGRFFGYEILENKMGRDEGRGQRKMKGIRDSKDSVLLMLMEDETGNKNGFCSGFRKQDIPAFLRNRKDTAKGYHAKDFVKTGRTKTICGYQCEEYKKDNADETMSIWVSKETSPWVTAFHKGVSGVSNDMPSATGFTGMAMEMDMLKKADQSSMVWMVTEVNKNTASTISTAGYTFPR